jgi:protein-S-isoprenylcysteine O-methyltransferase Ste14
MSDTAPNRLPWPPILYLAAIAISILLGVFVPLPWISRPMADMLFAAGCLCVVGVVAIDYAAFKSLKNAKTTIMPNRASDHLVTTGPFSFTRNPIYLANTLLMIGIGLIAQNLWFILLAFAAAFLTQKLAIEREERHLADRFGKRYRDYAKRVRRWI